MIYKKYPCYLCNTIGEIELIEVIDKRPPEETEFNIKKSDYYREIGYCKICGVYNDFHQINLEDLYKGAYNRSTYANKILRNYSKIMKLPYAESDNKQRVQRIVSFLKDQSVSTQSLKVLDVGSGLCVFLGELQTHGIDGYCLDPDVTSIEHAKVNVKVKDAYCTQFENFAIDYKFGLITFNKTLEHVTKPVDTLSKAQNITASNGIVYIELPDGHNSSAAEGVFLREEFFIEHYTIFTERSVEYLAHQAGYKVLEMRSINEPSNKYTIYAFLGLS